MHDLPVAHTVPQAPQFMSSFQSEVSHPGMESQSPKPNEQLHALALQVALTPHALPQLPQLSTSRRRTLSQPVLGSPSQLSKPERHVNVHVPAVQAAVAFVAPGHVCPQVPQLLASVVVSVHVPPHRSGIAPVQWHVPIWHVLPVGHAWPQLPQFARSVAVFVHVPPHRSGVAPLQLAVQAPAWHRGVPAGHGLPQAPQWSASVARLLSHPGTALQSVQEPVHGLPVSMHSPSLHWAQGGPSAGARVTTRSPLPPAFSITGVQPAATIPQSAFRAIAYKPYPWGFTSPKAPVPPSRTTNRWSTVPDGGDTMSDGAGHAVSRETSTTAADARRSTESKRTTGTYVDWHAVAEIAASTRHARRTHMRSRVSFDPPASHATGRHAPLSGRPDAAIRLSFG